MKPWYRKKVPKAYATSEVSDKPVQMKALQLPTVGCMHSQTDLSLRFSNYMTRLLHKLELSYTNQNYVMRIEVYVAAKDS